MKKGFTLIEMLGIITVLALLLLVTFPNLSRSLKLTKENSKNNFTNNLKVSAETYVELNRDNYGDLDIPGTEISFTVQDLYDANLLKGIYEDVNSEDKIKVIVGTDGILRYFFNGKQIGIEKQELDDNLSREIALIKENISSTTLDGVYYFNSEGNLEDNANIIYLTRNWNKRSGNILVHNHQFISGCIQLEGTNYDYYKGTLTELDYSCSTIRGENLVLNGDLSFGDNTNFSGFTYVAEEGTNGYLTKTVSGKTINQIDQFIPVDPNKYYEIGFTAKSNNPDLTYYIGFVPYNENMERILSNYVMYINNTLTTLSRDLNNGDEYVYLTDMTNWKINSTENQGYYKGFIFWNYKDSTGYEYPELTYSKNTWKNLYENENIYIVNNKIKLNEPWNHGYIPSGTKLSQSSEGASFFYSLRANEKLTENYETYSAVIQGMRTSSNRIATRFDPGTKYIKFTIQLNYNGTPNTIYFKDVYIREVIE